MPIFRDPLNFYATNKQVDTRLEHIFTKKLNFGVVNWLRGNEGVVESDREDGRLET